MNDEDEPSTGSIDLLNVEPGSIVTTNFEVPRPKYQWVLTAVVGLTVAAMLALGVWHIASQAGRIESLTERNSTLARQVTDLIEINRAQDENAQRLYDQLIELGETPDGTRPTSIPGPSGATGPQGPRGIPGRDGEDGADGLNGADGAPGADGADGTNGAEGPAGPMGPAGADGAPGAPGAPGADGRGIASIECTGVDTITITYTDNTTQSLTIPCVPALAE